MGAARVFGVNGYCMKSIALIYFIVFHLEDVIFHFQDDRTQNPSDLNLQITEWVEGRGAHIGVILLFKDEMKIYHGAINYFLVLEACSPKQSKICSGL